MSHLYSSNPGTVPKLSCGRACALLVAIHAGSYWFASKWCEMPGSDRPNKGPVNRVKYDGTPLVFLQAVSPEDMGSSFPENVMPLMRRDPCVADAHLGPGSWERVWKSRREISVGSPIKCCRGNLGSQFAACNIDHCWDVVLPTGGRWECANRDGKWNTAVAVIAPRVSVRRGGGVENCWCFGCTSILMAINVSADDCHSGSEKGVA